MKFLMVAVIGTLLLATAPTTSAQIVVPDDYPHIQDALDAAPVDGVVVIRPGFTLLHQPLLISKPVSLVGDPEFSLTAQGCGEDSGWPLGALWLDGPGAGTVRVIGMRSLAFGPDCVLAPPVIAGGGFAALHIYDSELQGSLGNISGGGGAAGAGIDVDVDVAQVVITNSTVQGGFLSWYECSPQAHDGATAVRAPGATVIAVDSVITGGVVSQTNCCGCACPADTDGYRGVGGVGVEAAALFEARCEISGGTGADVVAYLGGPSAVSVVCEQLPAGAPLQVAEHVTLSGQVLIPDGDSLAHLGQPFAVVFGHPPSPVSKQLFASPGVASPQATPFGLAFLDLQALFLVATVNQTQGPFSVQLAVPNLPTLVGVDLTLQSWSSVGGLSTPLMTAIVP